MDIYLTSSIRREELAAQLIEMAELDLAVREKLQAENRLLPGYNPEMEIVHRRHAARLREIIAETGWPTRSKVGEQASDAAWLIVQHSIGEAAFMKGCYQLMQLVKSDINPSNLAYLHDRICYFTGRPQRYGTQFDGDELYPVEDAIILNNLREGLQLPPLPAELIDPTGSTNAHLAGGLHSDPEFNKFRKKAGWI